MLAIRNLASLTLLRVVVAAMILLATGTTRAAAQGRPDDLPGVGNVEIEGELDVLYEDDEQEGKLLHFVNRDNNQRIRLKFKDGDGPNLLSGTKVRVRGDYADGTLTTTTTSVTSLAIAPSRTLGSQSILVILMNFSNNKLQPWTSATIASVNDQVRNFYLESSYGQTNLNFTVVGWYTIAATDSTCDYYTWATQAEALASAAGVNLAAYARRVIAFPKAAGCTWGGVGNLGGPRSWINGSYVLRTVAHEQGHNLGNYHSRAQTCDSTSCSTVDYGDDRDVLGVPGTVGHMNAFQKERLGFLNYGVSPVIQTVTTSGDYWIDNYELNRGTTKALKVWNAAQSSYYYIESRARTGFDSNVAAGVTMHSGSPSTGYGFQVDMAPATTTWDSTLDVGQVFTDPAMGLSVQTLSTSLDGAMIRVVFGSSPSPSPEPEPTPTPTPTPTCTRSAPTVTLSPSSQVAAAGSTAQFSVTVKNNNSGCAASGFSVSATLPAGWSGSVAGSGLASLASGASTTATLSVTLPAGTSGSYPFIVSAVDVAGGYTGAANGSVSTPTTSTTPTPTPTPTVTTLSVSNSATVSGNKGNQQISVTTTVRNGTAPLANIVVTVTVKSPENAMSALSGTTAADGSVTLKHTVKGKDPAGTYTLQSVASANGTSGSATTSVTVSK